MGTVFRSDARPDLETITVYQDSTKRRIDFFVEDCEGKALVSLSFEEARELALEVIYLASNKKI